MRTKQEGSHFCLHQKTNCPAPWSWTFQNYEKINLLFKPLSGILLWQSDPKNIPASLECFKIYTQRGSNEQIGPLSPKSNFFLLYIFYSTQMDTKLIFLTLHCSYPHLRYCITNEIDCGQECLDDLGVITRPWWYQRIFFLDLS